MTSRTFRVARNVQTNKFFVGCDDPKDTKFGYEWTHLISKASKFGVDTPNSHEAIESITQDVKQYLNQDIVAETYRKETIYTKVD